MMPQSCSWGTYSSPVQEAAHLFGRQLTCSGGSAPVQLDWLICSHLIHRLLKTQCRLWYSPWEENTFECQDRLPGKASNYLNCQPYIPFPTANGTATVLLIAGQCFGRPICCLIFLTLNTLLALLPLSFVALLCGVISLYPSPEILSSSALLPLLKVLLPALPFPP